MKQSGPFPGPCAGQWAGKCAPDLFIFFGRALIGGVFLLAAWHKCLATPRTLQPFAIHALAFFRPDLSSAMRTDDHLQFIGPVPIEFAAAGHQARFRVNSVRADLAGFA